MEFDFDEVVNRIGTGSIKWDAPARAHNAGHAPQADRPQQGLGLIAMGVADMDFRVAPAIVDALSARLREGILGYTHPDDDYFDAVQGWMSGRYNWTTERSWILPGAGSVPAINIAIQMLTNPGEGIIVQPPVFHPFAQSVENNGRRVVPNPLRLIDGRYVMDFEDLSAKAADPAARMLILCSPHNPVGRVWSKGELHQLAEICKRNDLIVVCDEVHADLAHPWARFTSLAAAAPEIEDRLVHCHGPSKTFNLPGLKISTTIIPNQELRDRFLIGLRNLNELFGVSALGVEALKAAYTRSGDWHDALMRYLAGNLRLLKEYLASDLPDLQLVGPEATYLAWIDCRGLGLPTDELRQRLIDKANLWVEDGGLYGREGEGFLRMNIACPRSVLQDALERMRACCY